MAVTLGTFIVVAILAVQFTLAAFSYYQRDRVTDRAPLGDERFPPAKLRELAIARVLADYSREDGRRALSLLRELLVRPEEYVERVIEDAEIQHQSLTLRTSVSISLPDDAPNKMILIPLLWIAKGQLAYNFQVEDRQGKDLCLVSQAETKALLSIIIGVMYQEAYSQTPVTEQHFKTLVKDVWDYERVDLVADLIGLTPSGLIHSRDELTHICELLSQNYLFLVEAKTEPRAAQGLKDGGSRILISSKRDIPLTPQTEIGSTPFPQRTVRRLRLGFGFILGARPNRLAIPVSWPFRTQSYHFRISGESGQYVHQHSLMDLDHTEMEIPNTLPWVSIREPSGLPFGHLQLNRFKDFKAGGTIGTRVEFREVPPGVLGMATLVAVFLSLLLCIFNWVYPFYRNADELPLFPAFLIAFAGFIPSWLGFASDRDSVIRSSLLARFGMFFNSVIAITSSLLYANVKWLCGPIYHAPFFDGHPFVVWWFLMALISIINTSMLAFSFLGRAFGYACDLQKY